MVYFGGGLTNHQLEMRQLILLTIQSGGIAQDFGDLTVGSNMHRFWSKSSKNKICFWSGGFHIWVNTIEFVTIATTGNAIDFGDQLLQQSKMEVQVMILYGLELLQVVIT